MRATDEVYPVAVETGVHIDGQGNDDDMDNNCSDGEPIYDRAATHSTGDIYAFAREAELQPSDLDDVDTDNGSDGEPVYDMCASASPLHTAATDGIVASTVLTKGEDAESASDNDDLYHNDAVYDLSSPGVGYDACTTSTDTDGAFYVRGAHETVEMV